MDAGTIAAGIVALQQAGGSSGTSLIAVKQKAAAEQAIAQMVAEAADKVAASNHSVDLVV